MTITALSVITDAYERCNRLSPGETLSADDAAFGLRRLNSLVDEMSAKAQFLYKNVQTSAAQTGDITLGAGSWVAINPGDEIVSVAADNFPLRPITMQQYNELYVPTTTGTPNVWAQDGLSTVHFYPSPNGQTIRILTRAGVAAFADATTVYTVPAGYAAFLGAALAVRVAPTLLGKLPPELVRAEKVCMDAIDGYQPAIVDVTSYTRPCRSAGRIFNGG